MKPSSATGRSPARRPNRQAKVIPLPTRYRKRRKRAFRIALAIILAALASAAMARFFLARAASSPAETIEDPGDSGPGFLHTGGHATAIGSALAPRTAQARDVQAVRAASGEASVEEEAIRSTTMKSGKSDAPISSGRTDSFARIGNGPMPDTARTVGTGAP